MHASFIVNTPWGGGGGVERLEIYEQEELNSLQNIHPQSTPDDLENIPIQIYNYFCTMSPTSLHLKQMSTATRLLVQMKFTYTIQQIIINLRHDNL